ncbi:MAG: lipoyl(octanoyl) transferase LipB [Deltaproteobacteria bacterium]|nr:lipoyl(octanoyl) transferase LipB [Deltaproteobacteria bacterium]
MRLDAAFFGRVPYPRGVALMNAAAQALAAGKAGPRLLMFEHPPIVTLGVRGRGSSFLIPPSELATRGVDLWRADRGGDATWHGPGQLVGYPVVDLRVLHFAVPIFVLAVEEALIRWLGDRGAECIVKKGFPGVWTPDGGKIASIGVRVARGITTHGFALNLEGPLPGSETIAPCGMRGGRLTTLERLTGGRVPPREAAPGVAAAVAAGFGLACRYRAVRTRAGVGAD